MCSKVFSTRAAFLPGIFKEFAGFGKIYFDCDFIFFCAFSGDPPREEYARGLAPCNLGLAGFSFGVSFFLSFRVPPLGDTFFVCVCVCVLCVPRARVLCRVFSR